MYFTSGSDRAFEQLMQGKPGFDHYDSGEAVTPEDCGTCRFYRPHWKYQFCVYAECRKPSLLHINRQEDYQPSRKYKRNDTTSFTPIRRGGMSARKQVRRNITIPP